MSDSPLSGVPFGTTIYTVREQYPHRACGAFRTLEEAQEYIREHAGELNMPIITSRDFYGPRYKHTVVN